MQRFNINATYTKLCALNTPLPIIKIPAAYVLPSHHTSASTSASTSAAGVVDGGRSRDCNLIRRKYFAI